MSDNGKKYDQGKPQLSLLDYGFLEGIAKIREYGVEKYNDPESWKHVPDALKRYKDAMLRHLFAFLDGKELDEESGLRHWDHFKCNVMFIDYFLKQPEPKKDHEACEDEGEPKEEKIPDGVKTFGELQTGDYVYIKSGIYVYQEEITVLSKDDEIIKINAPKFFREDSPSIPFELLLNESKCEFSTLTLYTYYPYGRENEYKKPDAAVGITQRGQIVFSSDIEEPEEELVITTFANFKNGDKIYYDTDGDISVKSGDVKIDQKNVSNMYFHVLNSDLDESVQFKVETNSDYDVSKDVSFYAYEDKYHEM